MKMRKWIVFIILLVGVLSLATYAIKGSIVPRKVSKVEEYKPWDPELVNLVAEMPVQDEGRLKPFSTWAMFRLYGIHSKRKIKMEVDGEKVVLTPTEWMLDCIFRPELANTLPSFRMEDARIAEALSIGTGTFVDSTGKEVTKKRRDLYSFNEIYSPAFEVEYAKQRAKNLKQLEKGKAVKGFELQKSNLIQSVAMYRQQAAILDLARFLASTFDETDLEKELGRKPTPEEVDERLAALVMNSYLTFKLKAQEGDEQVLGLWNDASFCELRMIPSFNKDSDKWVSYDAALQDIVLNEVDKDAIMDAIPAAIRWVKMAHAYKTGGEVALLAEFKRLRKDVDEQVAERGENLDKVESEIIYYNRKYYSYAFGFYFLGCLTMIVLLPSPQSLWGKIFGYLSLVCAIVATAYVAWGLIHRAEIMGRYPLGNLYDTILMITALAVAVLLFMELLTRKKVCIAVAVTLGLMGMFLANRFEVGEGADNMKPLQAVLVSDYWLATHVTAISIGYAGGLLAAALSTFYLLARMTGIDEGDKSFRRLMTRLAYGAACFTLIFSLVGTILGGVWANDSWGRFWGWDPKENGALMIVLWFLAILHARLAGYIKEWGLHICMVLGAIIIGFSWWGVNFLATGLHNYGFASGGSGEFWLNIYYLVNAVVAVTAIGFAWYDLEMKKHRKLQREAVKEAEQEPPTEE